MWNCLVIVYFVSWVSQFITRRLDYHLQICGLKRPGDLLVIFHQHVPLVFESNIVGFQFKVWNRISYIIFFFLIFLISRYNVVWFLIEIHDYFVFLFISFAVWGWSKILFYKKCMAMNSLIYSPCLIYICNCMFHDHC